MSTSVTGEIITAVMGRLNSATGLVLQTLVGERYRAQNDAPPRVVWVPTRDVFGAPLRIGEMNRQVRAREAGFAVDFWAAPSGTVPPDSLEDLAAAEALQDALLVALHQELRARYGAGDWYSVESTEWHTAGQLSAQGYGGTVSLTLKVPVKGESPVSVRALTATWTEQIR